MNYLIELYEKNLEGRHFKLNGEKIPFEGIEEELFYEYIFGKRTKGHSVKIYWTEPDGTEGKSERYSIKTVFDLIKNESWLLVKRDLIIEKIELRKNI